MDIFRPKRNRKFILVYKNNMRVLDDYIQTLMMFDEIIELSDFDSSEFQNTNDVFECREPDRTHPLQTRNGYDRCGCSHCGL